MDDEKQRLCVHCGVLEWAAEDHKLGCSHKGGHKFMDDDSNPHSVFNLVKRLNAGATHEELEAEIEKVGKERAKEEGKAWGECESCGQTTVLVEEVGLCGPCCFGESETYNGNF